MSEVGILTDNLTATLTAVLAELNSAAIPGFGTFESAKTDERIVTENGERILMPPAIDVRFNPSVVLRNKLKQP